MNYDEKKMQKLLNKDDIEYVFIDDYNLMITTDEHELIISSETKLSIETKDREYIE